MLLPKLRKMEPRGGKDKLGIPDLLVLVGVMGIKVRTLACASLSVGEKTNGNGPCLLGSLDPGCLTETKQAPKQRTTNKNDRVLGFQPVAVCRCEVFGFSPLAVHLVKQRRRKKQEGQRQAVGARSSCCRRAIKSASEKDEECRGRLTTRGNGAKPNTRRSGPIRCCTCAAASGVQAVRMTGTSSGDCGLREFAVATELRHD